MGTFQLPQNHSVGQGSGAATGVAIPIGIRSVDTLLAVISFTGSGSATGHDPAAFTVSEGSIQSATISTAGRRVCAIWQLNG